MSGQDFDVQQDEDLRDGEISEWRPIETAPKDGTWCLLFSQENIEPIRIRYWSCRKLNGRLVEGWWSAWGTFSPEYNPTHWMPVPLLPASSDFDKAGTAHVR